MDMKIAWSMAREKAAKEGGSSKDYIGEMMRLQWQEKKAVVSDEEKKDVVIPDSIALRLDPMHKALAKALFEKGDYKNTSGLFREALRYLATRELSDDEIIEIVMAATFEV